MPPTDIERPQPPIKEAVAEQSEAARSAKEAEEQEEAGGTDIEAALKDASNEVRLLVKKSQETFVGLMAAAKESGADKNALTAMHAELIGIQKEMQGLLEQHQADLRAAQSEAETAAGSLAELGDLGAELGLEMEANVSASEVPAEIVARSSASEKAQQIIGKHVERAGKKIEALGGRERLQAENNAAVDGLAKAKMDIPQIINGLDSAVTAEAIQRAIVEVETNTDSLPKESKLKFEKAKNDRDTAVKDIEQKFVIPDDLRQEQNKLIDDRKKVEENIEKLGTNYPKFDEALKKKEANLESRIAAAKVEIVAKEAEAINKKYIEVVKDIALKTSGPDVLKGLLSEDKIDQEQIATELAKQLEGPATSFSVEAYVYLPGSLLEKTLNKIPDDIILNRMRDQALKARPEFSARYEAALKNVVDGYAKESEEIKKISEEMDRIDSSLKDLKTKAKVLEEKSDEYKNLKNQFDTLVMDFNALKARKQSLDTAIDDKRSVLKRVEDSVSSSRDISFENNPQGAIKVVAEEFNRKGRDTKRQLGLDKIEDEVNKIDEVEALTQNQGAKVEESFTKLDSIDAAAGQAIARFDTLLNFKASDQPMDSAAMQSKIKEAQGLLKNLDFDGQERQVLDDKRNAMEPVRRAQRALEKVMADEKPTDRPTTAEKYTAQRRQEALLKIENLIQHVENKSGRDLLNVQEIRRLISDAESKLRKREQAEEAGRANREAEERKAAEAARNTEKEKMAQQAKEKRAQEIKGAVSQFSETKKAEWREVKKSLAEKLQAVQTAYTTWETSAKQFQANQELP
ncbi:MAG: hypothetical protein EXS55_04630, partial [Candidatus Magasanikbacteria bacterium]|nr:hypothetical protein [Candidatus Magasanikbacteria bacterium]